MAFLHPEAITAFSPLLTEKKKDFSKRKICNYKQPLEKAKTIINICIPCLLSKLNLIKKIYREDLKRKLAEISRCKIILVLLIDEQIVMIQPQMAKPKTIKYSTKTNKLPKHVKILGLE